MAKRNTYQTKEKAKPTQKADNLVIINFEAHKPPTFKEQKGKDWILYGAETEWKNNYPAFLLHLYNESATHNAIINGKVKYISGQGWIIDKELPLNEKMAVSSFINNVGSDSAHELLKKLSLDLSLFGGFAVQPIWNKKGDKLTLHFVEFCHVRSSENGETFYYTKDWSTRSPETNEDWKEFTPFDPESKGENQLIYYKEYRPNLQEYPLPDYQAGINYISSDIDIATFIASNTSNGFSGGTIVNLYNGEPTNEAKRHIENQFKRKFTGADKAGALMLSFNDPDTQGTEIIPLADNGQDDRFMNLNEQVQNKIFISHQATSPVLFGVKAENGLGNNADEIRTASEHLQNTYVTPKQKVFEDLFNYILGLQGLPEVLKIQDLEPVKAQLSEQVIMQISTNAELREMAGLPPIKEEASASNVADILGTLSPLVATKVLDAMSQEEIRNLVGLSGSVVSKSTTNEFRKQDDDELLFQAFETLGFSDDEIEVVSEQDIHYNPFTFAVSEVDKQILDLIGKNPKITVDEIAKATGETIEQTNHRLTVLAESGNIKVDGDEIKVEKDEQPDEELITVYKYVERPGVPAARSGSRSFCRRLMAGNRNYTRENVATMINDFGQLAFTHRGGWYHNPNTDITTPYCRHVWRARTVKVKK